VPDEVWQRTMEDPIKYAHKTNNLGLIKDAPIPYEQQAPLSVILGILAFLVAVSFGVLFLWNH